MLGFAFILAIASSFFELMIAAKIPIWRRLSAQSLLFNLANSMVLSYVVGIMFGASGLIAMTAGIFSTILSIPGYKFLYWNFDSPGAQARGGNQMVYLRENVHAKREAFHTQMEPWVQLGRDLSKLIYKILRVITFPFWFARACLVKYQDLKARLARP